MKKKILVCGATGFVGRNIAEYLAERKDFEIYGTSHGPKFYKHPGIELREADLTDKKTVDSFVSGMDVIVHAAAVCSGANDIINQPYIHLTDNVRMSPLIFQSAFEQGVKHVLFPSSSTMYHSSDRALKETDTDLNLGFPKNYFACAWTKIFLEKSCSLFSELGKTKYTVFRNSNIYGPYDKFDLQRSHVFGATITKVMTAPDRRKIVIWGNGEEERDLIYVSDVARFVEAAIDKQESQFEIFNVGYGKPISVKNLVEKIIRASGKRLEVEYDSSKPTIKTKVWLDSTKAKSLIGWEPRVSLEEGIKKTMEWYRENKI